MPLASPAVMNDHHHGDQLPQLPRLPELSTTSLSRIRAVLSAVQLDDKIGLGGATLDNSAAAAAAVGASVSLARPDSSTRPLTRAGFESDSDVSLHHPSQRHTPRLRPLNRTRSTPMLSASTRGLPPGERFIQTNRAKQLMRPATSHGRAQLKAALNDSGSTGLLLSTALSLHSSKVIGPQSSFEHGLDQHTLARSTTDSVSHPDMLQYHPTRAYKQLKLQSKALLTTTKYTSQDDPDGSRKVHTRLPNHLWDPNLNKSVEVGELATQRLVVRPPSAGSRPSTSAFMTEHVGTDDDFGTPDTEDKIQSNDIMSVEVDTTQLAQGYSKSVAEMLQTEGQSTLTRHQTPESNRSADLEDILVLCKDGQVVRTEKVEHFLEYSAGLWGNMNSVIASVEILCSEYDIEDGLFSGVGLLKLAYSCALGRRVSILDLALCAVDHDLEEFHGETKDQVNPPKTFTELIAEPGRRFRGHGGRTRAAIAIQTAYRKYKSRLGYLEWRQQVWAGKLVVTRIATKLAMKSMVARRQEAVKQEQVKYVHDRLMSPERWLDISKRLSNIAEVTDDAPVVVFLPSLDVDKDTRDRLSFFALQFELSQVFQLLSPELRGAKHFLFISSSNSAESLWERLLNILSHSKVAPSVLIQLRSKVKFIKPDYREEFNPLRISLASQLSLSFVTVNKLKETLAEWGVPHSHPLFMLPAVVGPPTIELATVLNAEAISANPDIYSDLNSASGARDFFRSIELGTLVHKARTTSLISDLAALIALYPNARSWCTYLENDVAANGAAHVSTNGIPCWNEMVDKWQRIGISRWSTSKTRQEYEVVLRDQLPNYLSEYATFVAESNRNWSEYEAAFRKEGGIIEMCTVEGDMLGRITLDLFLAPGAAPTLLLVAAASEDGFLNKTCYVSPPPANLVSKAWVTNVIDRISAALCANKVYGHVSVEFALAGESMYATGLNVGIPSERVGVRNFLLQYTKSEANSSGLIVDKDGDEKQIVFTTSWMECGLAMLDDLVLRQILELHTGGDDICVFPINEDDGRYAAFCMEDQVTSAADKFRTGLRALWGEISTPESESTLASILDGLDRLVSNQEVSE